MSTETIKFFEDKSTEDIINWMLNHLTEEQIKMCLDQTGIPKTDLSSPSTQDEGGRTITRPDGTVKKLQKGEGSSSDPLPQTAQAIAEEIKNDIWYRKGGLI